MCLPLTLKKMQLPLSFQKEVGSEPLALFLPPLKHVTVTYLKSFVFDLNVSEGVR